MAGQHYEAAVAALVELANNTGSEPEAAVINAVSDAARQSGLVPSQAPYHPKDFGPKSVVRLLVRVAETTLNAEAQHRTATGQH
ncbi:hypothetical protein Stsp02_11610 [Streptomyces sp. NBRC 14336]|uniref:hypothetical protein n=1 Tax=Streptomyces sp. NBRC 14336 TaxID=3030992 RepID=UPI0024A2D6D1|nr:hypothetical protein [Streptomyces sp. NBRC 14336]GLW45499.1 hypothetical protein Stsp02_11610 [Streptomyces sp. NBRC 14336]